MAASVQTNTASSPGFPGRVFSGSGTGPAPKDFHKTPGIYQGLYNKAAESIGLPHVKADARAPANPLVVRALDRLHENFHIDQRTPQDQAAKLVRAATSTGLAGVERNHKLLMHSA
jgi:hypothetical protein